jgi:hypothetical protein
VHRIWLLKVTNILLLFNPVSNEMYKFVCVCVCGMCVCVWCVCGVCVCVWCVVFVCVCDNNTSFPVIKLQGERITLFSLILSLSNKLSTAELNLSLNRYHCLKPVLNRSKRVWLFLYYVREIRKKKFRVLNEVSWLGDSVVMRLRVHKFLKTVILISCFPPCFLPFYFEARVGTHVRTYAHIRTNSSM